MRPKYITVRLISIFAILLALLGCGKDTQLSIKEQLDLGNRYLAELNYEQAALTFQGVIEVENRNVDAWYGYAQSYVGLAESAPSGDVLRYYQEAVDAYEMVLELEPERTEEYLELAELYEQMEMPEEAVAVLERGLTQAENREAIQERVDAMRDIAGDLERYAEEQTYQYGKQYYGYLSLLNREEYRFLYDFSEVPLGPLGYLIEDLDDDGQKELFLIGVTGEQRLDDTLGDMESCYMVSCQVYEWLDGRIVMADSVVLQDEEMTLKTLFSYSEVNPGVFECYLYGEKHIGIEIEDAGGLIGDGSRSNFVSLRYDGSQLISEGHAYYFGSSEEYDSYYVDTLQRLSITGATWDRIIYEGHAISEYVSNFRAIVRMESINLLSFDEYYTWMENGEGRIACVELRFFDFNGLKERTGEQHQILKL